MKVRATLCVCYTILIVRSGASVMMVSQWRGNVEIYDLFWLSADK